MKHRYFFPFLIFWSISGMFGSNAVVGHMEGGSGDYGDYGHSEQTMEGDIVMRSKRGTNALSGHEMEHFEGDIAMRSKPAAGGQGAMLSALRDTSKRWPGGRVPYSIDTVSIPNLEHQRIIRSAMDHISRKISCINFIENQKLARPKLDFIRIASDGDDKNSALGCWSYLGMIGGEQKKTQVNQRATTSKEKQHNIPPRKSIEDNEYYSSVRVTKDNKSTRKSVDDDEYYSSVRVNKDDDNFLEENNSNGKDTDKEDAYYWNAGEGNNTTADEDTYDSPAADEDTYNSPAADEDTYDSPAADEDTYDSPAADEDTYVSFVDEDRKDSAAVDINSQRARYLKSTKK